MRIAKYLLIVIISIAPLFFEAQAMSILKTIVKNADEAVSTIRGSDDATRVSGKYNLNDYPRGTHSVDEEVAKILDNNIESHIVPPLNKSNLINNDELLRDELINIDWNTKDSYVDLNKSINNLLEEDKITKVNLRDIEKLHPIPEIEFLRAVWYGGRISQYYIRQSDRESLICEGLQGRVIRDSNVYLMNDFEIYLHGKINNGEAICIIGKDKGWYVIPFGLIESKNVIIETNIEKTVEEMILEFQKINKTSN